MMDLSSRFGVVALSALVAFGGTAIAASPLVPFAGRIVQMDRAPLTVNPLKADSRRAAAAPGASVLTLDRPAYEALRGADRAVFPGFTLEGAKSLTATLELERFEVFTDDAKLIVVTDDGEIETPRPDMQLWRGTVAGEPGSIAFIAMTPTWAQGYVRSGGETYLISSGERGDSPTMIFGASGPAGKAIPAGGTVCEGGLIPPGIPPEAILPERPNTGESSDRGGFACKQYRIAVETDNEFAQRLGSTTAAQNYATLLMAASSEIYQRDLNIQLKMSYLRIWTTADPWTAANTGAQLDQFVSYWNQNMTSVPRDLAHFFSTRGLGGGVAYLNATCTGFGYGVSANMSGFFPYPLVNHNGSNWDVNVISHEMGHNFGTGHTHEINWYNPIIDGCGLAYVGGVQDCSQAFSAGSIMSYCHLCGGGMTNITLNFPPRVASTIRGWVDGGGSFCGKALPAVATNPAPLSIEEGDPITLSASFENIGVPNYQWKRNGNNLTNGGRFSGVNSPNLSISPSLTTDAGNYTLTVSGDCGTKTTAAATVLVAATCPQGNSRPTISQQPVGLSAFAGQTAELTVAATDIGPVTYQWRKGLTVLTNQGSISGADSPTLTISPLTLDDSGGYNVVVTGPQCSSTSALANISVTPPPPEAFALLSPANGATNVPTNTALDWADSAGVNTYRVTLDNDTDFSSPVFDLVTIGSSIGLAPGTIQIGNTYFWKVTATNDFGVTASTPAVFSFTASAPPPPCEGDINGDHTVNTIDLAFLLARFGQTEGIGQALLEDVNNDGVVNTADLTIVLSQFGRTNCP